MHDERSRNWPRFVAIPLAIRQFVSSTFRQPSFDETIFCFALLNPRKGR